MEQVWETEGERAGGLSPGWTWPGAARTKPSSSAWLLLGLGNRTFVGKQDGFKDTRWQYQFFFVRQNTWSPWILPSHLDQGTCNSLSLAPWHQPWGSADGLFSKSRRLCLFREKKSAYCRSAGMLEGKKSSHGKSKGPGSSVGAGFSVHSGETTATSQCASPTGMWLVPFIFVFYIYICYFYILESISSMIFVFTWQPHLHGNCQYLLSWFRAGVGLASGRGAQDVTGALQLAGWPKGGSSLSPIFYSCRDNNRDWLSYLKGLRTLSWTVALLSAMYLCPLPLVYPLP